MTEISRDEDKKDKQELAGSDFKPIHYVLVAIVAIVTIALGIFIGTYINQYLTQQQTIKENAANLEALNNNLPHWLFQIKAFPNSKAYELVLHKCLVAPITAEDLRQLSNDELILCAAALSHALANHKLHPKFVAYFAEFGIFDPGFINLGFDVDLLKMNYQTIANFLFQSQTSTYKNKPVSSANSKKKDIYKQIPSQPPGYETDPSPLPQPQPDRKSKPQDKSQPQSKPVLNKTDVKKLRTNEVIVCIDPGHGTINYSGKVTNIGASCIYNGRTVPEYELTLDYSVALKKELQRLGFKVIMVRDVNKPFIHDSEKYDSEGDNIKRAQIANEAKADFFIRIHFDGGPPEKRGFACWYNAQSDFDQNDILLNASKLLAELTFNEFKNTPFIARGIQTWSNRTLWGLKRSNAIAIIYECAFMSNPEDVKLIFTNEYKNACVKSISKALINMVKHHPHVILQARKLKAL